MDNPQIDLKALRRQKGWSQVQAAERIGFSRSYLADVENGRQGVSKKMMRAIIRVFGVEYEDFYQDSQERSE